MHPLIPVVLGALPFLGAAPQPAQTAPPAEPPLRVCAATPDLGSLVREVGGDRVDLTVFAKGTEDPHFLEARPSFIKAASEADIFIQSGLELETGWAPAILQSARNARIQVGGPGFLDASRAITPLEVPTGVVDRSLGDVHAAGNPHFLIDPLNGVKVAALIEGKLAELRPAERDYFHQRMQDFRTRVYRALVGPTLADKYDAEKLALLFEHGKLAAFLDGQGDGAALGGWLGRMSATHGIKAVADHNLWPYLARRYGISIVGYLEPKPGVPPTTRHLQELVDTIKRDDARLILSSVYFDPRHAAFVSRQTGARIVELAHQPGSRPGTDDYISMCDYNARQLAEGARK